MTSSLFFSILAALSVVLVSLVGLLFSGKGIRAYVTTYLGYLVTFSAGVFAFVAWHLFGEARELASAPHVLFALLLGFLFLFVLERVLPESHHHHDEDCEHSHKKHGAVKMFIGDAFHKVADGLILLPAFLVDATVGILTTASILVHEIVQNISEYFLLIDAGYTPRRATLRNLFVSSTIFIGVAISAIFSQTVGFQAGVIAFASGVFLYIVIHDRFPFSLFKTDIRKALVHTLCFVAGILLLYLVLVMLPELH